MHTIIIILFCCREPQDKMVLMELMEREVQRYNKCVPSFILSSILYAYYRAIKVNKEIQVLMVVMVNE